MRIWPHGIQKVLVLQGVGRQLVFDKTREHLACFLFLLFSHSHKNKTKQSPQTPSFNEKQGKTITKLSNISMVKHPLRKNTKCLLDLAKFGLHRQQTPGMAWTAGWLEPLPIKMQWQMWDLLSESLSYMANAQVYCMLFGLMASWIIPWTSISQCSKQPKYLINSLMGK
jgi:hypothetical protein